MFDAIYISAVGLQAQKQQLDMAANNFANLSTTAFKRQQVDFSVLLDRPPASSSAEPAPTSGPSRRLRVDLAQGELKATGRSLDVAILGNGFIEVEMADGGIGYSRGGALQINADGMLTLANGHALKANIRVPRAASSVDIRADGTVTARIEGERHPTVLGNIELATFANPESLQYQGDGIFQAREAASEPVRGRPGEDTVGKLVPGNLESSNVRMVDEMVSLMLMQRVYELNARVMQAADEMLGMTNNLRRA